MQHRNLILILLLGLLSSLNLYGQKNPMKYGNIQRQELEMQRYAADTTANAVILGDYGLIEIIYNNTKGFQYHFNRHLRVKILNKDAFELADFNLPLYSYKGNVEKIQVLKAAVYNLEDGKVKKTSFNRRLALEEEAREGLKYLNFTLPNVREGSVFEVEYTIISPFLSSLPVWHFQGEYPVVFSELNLLIPEYFNYKRLMQGFIPMSSTRQSTHRRSFEVSWEEQDRMGKTHRYRQNIEYIANEVFFRIDNVPAFIKEPYMNSHLNYLSKIEHELVTFSWKYGKSKDYSSTWEKLTSNLMESENFGKQLNRTGFISQEANRLKQLYPDTKERMIAAFELIQKEMAWNNVNSMYTRRTLSKAWSDKQGNAAEINLMLVVLLREAGLSADPVLLSTRANGIINPAQIMLEKFNYVIAIAHFDGQSILMDATQKHAPYYILPERCLNDQGRVISTHHGRWVKIDPGQENYEQITSLIKVKPCGSINADITRQYNFYERASFESKYRGFNNEEEFMNHVEASTRGAELENFMMENLNAWALPLSCNFHFSLPAVDSNPKQIIYIQPLLMDRMPSNPFRLEERQFPVDFTYAKKRSFHITIEIPQGYKVEEMPRNARLALSRRGGSYSSSYRVNDGNIEVKIEMELSKPIYFAEEYTDLRNFFTRIVEEEARTIVLKRELIQ
jgi:hypothetical protein